MTRVIRDTKTSDSDLQRNDEDKKGRLPLDIVDRTRAFAALGPDRWKRRRLLWRISLLPLLALAIAVGGIVGLYVQPPGLRVVMALSGLEPGGGTDRPIAVPVERASGATSEEAAKQTIGHGLVVALGTLLPESKVITIAPPFGAGDARIASLLVHEGEQVEAGQLLALLDSEQQFLAAIDTAQANVGVKEAMLAEQRASILASHDEALAAFRRAESAADRARREYERGETLSQRQVVSTAILDDRRAIYDQAIREVEEARATLSRYQSKQVDAQPDVVVAARNLDAARAELAGAKKDLEKARVRAPIDGTVLQIHARPGERPGDEGMMNIGNIDRMMVEVDVYQTQISLVSLGDIVEIGAAALPDQLHGRVSRVGLEVGRQTLIGTDPAANTDARVVQVTVALDDESSTIASRYTNLQVTARIEASGSP